MDSVHDRVAGSEEDKMPISTSTIGLAASVSLVVGALTVGAAAAAPTPRTMCMVHNNGDHPSIAALVRGANDEAAVYNAKITYFDPHFDPQKQVQMIEDCITRKPDVVAINAVDPAAVVPAIKKAHEAQIPVVMVNADTTAEGKKYTVTYVGVASVEQGHIAGVQFAQDYNGKTPNIVVLLGKPGQTDTVNRIAGFKAALDEAGQKVHILAQQPTDWDKDKALTAMQDLLTRFPNIDAVYSEDDTMSIAAMQAIKASGRTDIKIYSSGGMKEACQAIKDKDLIVVTAAQSSYLMGVYAVRAAYDYLNHRLVAAETLSPSGAISEANIDRWLSSCW
jgi:ABC-type sugar transport system substrate-binding protein